MGSTFNPCGTVSEASGLLLREHVREKAELGIFSAVTRPNLQFAVAQQSISTCFTHNKSDAENMF